MKVAWHTLPDLTSARGLKVSPEPLGKYDRQEAHGISCQPWATDIWNGSPWNGSSVLTACNRSSLLCCRYGQKPAEPLFFGRHPPGHSQSYWQRPAGPTHPDVLRHGTPGPNHLKHRFTSCSNRTPTVPRTTPYWRSVPWPNLRNTFLSILVTGHCQNLADIWGVRWIYSFSSIGVHSWRLTSLQKRTSPSNCKMSRRKPCSN